LDARRWQHLAVGTVILWLRYALRRVACPSCGICAEKVPWGESPSRFTSALEELAAYLAQLTDKTAVTKLMAIAWRTVGNIVERVVGSRLDPTRLDDLHFIGVDEFSYRKRHRYITVVVDHLQNRVVWSAKGKSAETLAAFFAELGPERARAIEVVTMDMSAAYIEAVQEHAPQAQIVFDRFHVQRLASDALDEVRRAQVRDLVDPEAKKAIKNTRFALLRNPWNVEEGDKAKLSEIQRSNKPLYRGYLLHHALAHVLGYAQRGRAEKRLEDWLTWASRSRLKPFVKLARTIRQHKDNILAYVEYRLTNGVVEGINNRLRMIARRAYGFHSAAALIGMLFLCCGGIILNPPLPRTVPLPT
jgi:transposase